MIATRDQQIDQLTLSAITRDQIIDQMIDVEELIWSQDMDTKVYGQELRITQCR